ncbi:DNA repair protein rad14 [Gurleya vavrai]
MIEEIFVDHPIEKNKKCCYCSSVPIDSEIFNVFNRKVCKKCKFDKLKLITKTTCKDNFLLCDEELKDFKYLTRPNPHKGTWNNMNLYLEDEINNFAIEKYGSLDKIEILKNERIENMLERKKNRMKKSLRELKRKTIVKTKNSNDRHEHDFYYDGNKKKCKCGLEFEEENI